MISPELIRRYPVFAGLTHENIVALANTGEELVVDTGYHFFNEGDELDKLYIVVEGAVAITMEIPAQEMEHSVSSQVTGDLTTEEAVVSAVGPGEVFAWSALVPPNEAMAGAKALAPSRVVAFDCAALTEAFKQDCRFGFLMMQRIAMVIRERMRNLRIESLSRVVHA